MNKTHLACVFNPRASQIAAWWSLLLSPQKMGVMTQDRGVMRPILKGSWRLRRCFLLPDSILSILGYTEIPLLQMVDDMQ